ncbi:beta-galactosidase [Candidatus Sumerlaeota bacterium]|nr:beta-galactosidase [Candidatus Sumerlaeota bacterium]
MRFLFFIFFFIFFCSTSFSQEKSSGEKERNVSDLEDRIPRLSTELPKPVKRKGDLRLGFVAHWSPRGLERYEENGAPSMLMNLLSWGMRDREKQLVDFSNAEKWLAYLYRTGIQGALIIDTSVHHTSIPWRSEITRKLGENLVFQNGQPSEFSSPYSPMYRKMIRQYIEDVTGWVKKHDTAHIVRTYVNGAEVFWPGILDYGNLARIEFRKWLQKEYGNLKKINERWGADFKKWADVNPVPFYRFGRLDLAPTGFFYENWMDASWSTPIPNLLQGKKYKIMADVKTRGIHDDRVQLEIAWELKGELRKIEVLECVGDTREKWLHLEKTIQVSEPFDKAVLLLTQESSGETLWKNPGVFPENENRNLIPDNPEDKRWKRSRWNGNPIFDISEDENKNKLFFIKCPPHKQIYKYDSAAWYDFVTFCMETYAQQMNDWAKNIKACDPSREVMHYLGFTLGMLGQWDDATLTQRADIFLSNAPDVDVNGIQLCAANGDFHYATIVLDLARKYNKPMVATDLQDFTHGVYAGFNKLNRLGLACIAHGMDGMYYYDWLGTKDYDWYENWEMEDTRRMIENSEKAIRFLEGFEPQNDAAYIIPILPYCEADPGGRKNDMLDSMGFYKIVCKLGFCPDVYTLYELTTHKDLNLQKYKAIFIPDCFYINPEALEALTDYVQSGGNLVMSGRAPRYDETGRELKERLISPDIEASDQDYLRIGKGKGKILFTAKPAGREFLGPVRRYRVAGNTPPLFQRERDNDSLTSGESETINLMRDIVKNLDMKPTLYLEPFNPYMEYAVYKKGNQYRAMLINTSSGSQRGVSIICTGRALSKEAEVLADFESAQTVLYESQREGKKFLLPPFTDCCTVIVRFKE